VVAATGGGSGWDWETELARKVAWGKQLIAEHDNTSIGFIQIIDPAAEPFSY
jgi:aminoglycoside 6'-N-acetyltransferase